MEINDYIWPSCMQAQIDKARVRNLKRNSRPLILGDSEPVDDYCIFGSMRQNRDRNHGQY